MNLDETDLKILAELAENSKSSYVEIGRKLGLHPNVVGYRVNRLEDVNPVFALFPRMTTWSSPWK